jgi:tRNA pseudouridine32 synthase/23S rRNA pseudouridine746 synthase
MPNLTTCFIPFKGAFASIKRPNKFTFPFYYTPHELSIQACEELQEYLSGELNWKHDFGITEAEKNPIGKMFGVLVVENENKELGYLSAFSGKMAGVNTLGNFVPPIYDMLREDGFFLKGQQELTEINKRVRELNTCEDIAAAQEALKNETNLYSSQVKELRAQMVLDKKLRKQKRTEAKELSEEQYSRINRELNKDSILQKNKLKELHSYWEERIEKVKQKEQKQTSERTYLKEKRKKLSAILQQGLFDEYHFLNAQGIKRSLLSIFKDTPQGVPPAAAGECAAPKLLQFAFLNNLKPIALAEFWWGEAPKSAIRKHKHYYPACQGKCLPILTHMLQGLEVDENPLLKNPAEGKTIEVVYEDDHLAVINKPNEFLSVPGKTIQDSVFSRMKTKYPEATGPLIVHRLDMSTSGIMLIAKTKEAHDHLQQQFIKRTIRKRYVALLDGIVKEPHGTIDLPLRLDIDDRPRQLVCYEHGKSARTKYEVIKIEKAKTRVHFYPITGRTHQLRVHASHFKGLNTAIIGDDLYGSKNTRLHLHAEFIDFTHPATNELVEFSVEAGF